MSRPGAPRDFAILAAFAMAALLAYGPALDGQFFSDDQHYVADNAYVQTASVQNLLAIWNPVGGAAVLVENYAPVHLTAYTLLWPFFESSTRGYHVVSVLMHALAAWLFGLVLRRSGLGAAASMALAAVFLLHPANVEAVAWIAQLKTPLSFALALGALLAHPKRPWLALLLFALALLAKPTAVFALPVVALLGLVRGGERWHWPIVAGWLLAFGLFALAEFAAFYQTAGLAPPIYPELDLRLRTVCAIALRYVVMAVTGSGLSVFHETPAAESWFDPWFLGALVLLGILGWRLVAALRMRRVESVYWAWAAISFAPICGVIPLPFPMADRYLYFILPGLLGAVAFASIQITSALRARKPALAVFTTPRGAGWIATSLVVVALLFGAQARARARVWVSPQRLMADAARNYPEGTAAMTRAARGAALAGDVDATVRALRRAMARGYNRLDHLLQDPAYHPYHEVPAFRAILEELAQEMIDRLGSRSSPSQMELRVVAQAHIVMHDLAAAEVALVRAIEVGGPLDEKTARELVDLRRQQRIAAEVERRRAKREASTR